MNRYTVDDVLAWGPCDGYDRERLEVLFAGRDSLTMLDILDVDIPVADKVWCICQDPPGGWLDVVVARAVTNHALHYGVSDVEVWAQQWLSGENKSKAAAAWATATAGAAAWTAGAAEYSLQVADARRILEELK